jgi:hypothetical protein
MIKFKINECLHTIPKPPVLRPGFAYNKLYAPLAPNGDRFMQFFKQQNSDGPGYSHLQIRLQVEKRREPGERILHVRRITTTS